MVEIRQRQVHLDFHTSEYIPNVASQFNAAQFAETLTKASVNSITCFARCHHGWLYYPSKEQPERIHPHLQNKQLLLEQIDACHQVGIKVPVYTTVQWDGYLARNHPEWLCVDGDGNYINSQGIPEPHFYYSLCLNSGYRDYFKRHLLDIIDVVGQDRLDGLFMDILFRVDCNCEHCQKEMRLKGIDPSTEKNRLYYSEIMLSEFKKEISALIREHAPNATIFYNGSHVGYADKMNLAEYSHLELESLPSGGWGYDHFPITMRYARNLGKKVIGMTGKFHTHWGDFHSLKNPEALEFEVLNMLALGAVGCSIGDQLHPDGRLSEAAYELIGGIYGKLKKMEPYCELCTIPEVEIGVLTPEETWVAGGHSLRTDPSLIGVNRLLQELNYQFDIIDSAMDFSKYAVIILPDVIEYNQTTIEKLQAYEQQGGAVIGSYQSLLSSEHPQNDLYGVTYLGEADFDRDFILPNERLGKNLPKEEQVMYLKGVKVAETSGEVVLHSVKSYFNRVGQTFCSHQHAPATHELGDPAAVQKGRVLYFSHPIFHIYRKNAARWIKELLRDSLQQFIPQKILVHDGPISLLSTVNRSVNQNQHLIHLLHYITKKSAEDIYTIDDIIPLQQVSLHYYIGNKKVVRVTDILTETELPYTIQGSYLELVLPEIVGHKTIEVITE